MTEQTHTEQSESREPTVDVMKLTTEELRKAAANWHEMADAHEAGLGIEGLGVMFRRQYHADQGD